MVRKRRTFRGHDIAQWLLNTALFVSLLLSSELTQQPQYAQSYQTELVLLSSEASNNTVARPGSYYPTDEKESDKRCSLYPFVHIQLHYASCLKAKLKNDRLIVPPVPIAVRYLQFQSTLPTFDEDHFVSLGG
jgi:hypothetical protein